jgi:porin
VRVGNIFGGAHRRCALAAAIFCGVFGTSTLVYAEDIEADSTGADQIGTDSIKAPADIDPVASPPADVAIPQAPPTNPYARFDRLKEHGALIRLPPISETVVRDAGGFRTALADKGFGFMFISLNSAAYDLHSADSSGRQYYNGQDLSATGSQQLVLSYNFAPRGRDESQIVFGVVSQWASWEPLGPRASASLTRLVYYRSFQDKKWEMKLGYIGNSLEFMGTATGGSMTGGTQGPNAVIPYLLGLSRVPMVAPGMNLTYNGRNGFYNKLGLQRSTSPDGPQAEIDRNDRGFRFRTPGSGLLVVNEVGVKKDPTPTTGQVWFRAGVMHNSSDYRRFKYATRSDDNYAYYIAYDRQVSDPATRAHAMQGWYLGATVNYAPPDRNLYTRYYEARAYKIGPFASRPADMFSIVANHTQFSRDAVQVTRANGATTDTGSSAFTLSYMARLYPGTFLSAGLSYTDHPTFSPELPSSVNALVGLNFFF